MTPDSPDALGRAEAARRARIGAVVLAAARMLPVSSVERVPIVCPVRRVTGRPCPGCGLTRSLVRMMHGDVAGSFRIHPAGPATAALLGYWAVTGSGHADGWADPRTWGQRRYRPLVAVGAAGWTAWALARAARAR